MRPNFRLFLCWAMILVSLIYGVLISINSQIALAIMVGYIAALLTILVTVNVWKKPHG